jgi:hypothetical protein
MRFASHCREFMEGISVRVLWEATLNHLIPSHGTYHPMIHPIVNVGKVF